MTRTDSKLLIAAVVLPLSLAALPSVTLAGETVTINIPVYNDDVYGNGDQPYGALPMGGAANLKEPAYNNVIIGGGRVTRGVFGAYFKSLSDPVTATNNTVTLLTGGEVYQDVFGGFAWSDPGSATATGNSVTLFSNGRVDQDVFGGYAESLSGSATATGNTVTLLNGGGVVQDVYGGGAESDSGPATATDNSVALYGGRVYGWVFGGDAYSLTGSATATNNSVSISGDSEVGGEVIGGYARTGSGSATATDNSVVISGGRFDDNIYGGYSEVSGSGTGSATRNTVNISGTPEFYGGLYGGFVGDSLGDPVAGADAFTGNTLNLHSTGLVVSGFGNFEYLNFYVPATLAADATVLSVTGTADITNSKVNVGIEGTSYLLKKGDSLTLIDAGHIDDGAVTGTVTGQVMESLVLRYGFDVATSGNQLRATVTSVGVNPQTKALSEAFLSGIALVNQSVDIAAGKGMGAMLDPQTPGFFGLVSGGSSRYNTGSHVNVDSLSLIAGVSGERKTGPGKLTLGAFVSHGEGDYDTHNSFSNAASVKGKGDTEHTGLGLLARLDFDGTRNGYSYLDASLQGGRVKTDFHSGDLRNGRGQGAKYDSSSNYYGMHLGAGHVWNLNANTRLDLYGQYLYARRGGDSVHLENTADTIRFSTVESHRARLGGRVAWALDRVKPYAGLAWEHEFDSEAKATAYGLSIDAPDLKGDTGVVELGLAVTPSRTLPVSLDFGIQGYTGKREGASGGVRVGYKF